MHPLKNKLQATEGTIKGADAMKALAACVISWGSTTSPNLQQMGFTMWHILAIIAQESSFDPTSTNNKGTKDQHFGLGQIEYKTWNGAAALGYTGMKVVTDGSGVVDSAGQQKMFDPVYNALMIGQVLKLKASEAGTTSITTIIQNYNGGDDKADYAREVINRVPLMRNGTAPVPNCAYLSCNPNPQTTSDFFVNGSAVAQYSEDHSAAPTGEGTSASSESSWSYGDPVEGLYNGGIIKFADFILTKAFFARMRDSMNQADTKTLFMYLKEFMAQFYHEIVVIPTLGLGKSLVVKPECLFLPPPRCNVILPAMRLDVNFSRNFKAEPTRHLMLSDLVLAQFGTPSPSPMNLITSVAVEYGDINNKITYNNFLPDQFSGAARTIVNGTYSDKTLAVPSVTSYFKDKKMAETLKYRDTTSRSEEITIPLKAALGLNKEHYLDVLTQYEADRGVRMIKSAGGADLFLFLASAGNKGQTRTQKYRTAAVQQTSFWKMKMTEDTQVANAADVLFKFAQYNLARARFATRGGQITTVFNPYLLPGYPLLNVGETMKGTSGGIIIDPESLTFYGYVDNITHTLSANGACSTSINYSMGHYVEEARPQVFPVVEEDMFGGDDEASRSNKLKEYYDKLMFWEGYPNAPEKWKTSGTKGTELDATQNPWLGDSVATLATAASAAATTNTSIADALYHAWRPLTSLDYYINRIALSAPDKGYSIFFDEEHGGRMELVADDAVSSTLGDGKAQTVQENLPVGQITEDTSWDKFDKYRRPAGAYFNPFIQARLRKYANAVYAGAAFGKAQLT